MTGASPYQSNAAEVPIVRRWFIVGLLVSLGLHGVAVVAFRETELPQFSAPMERLVPRAFTVNRAEIDPKLLADEPETLPEKVVLQEPSPVPVPPEEESFLKEMKEVRLTPEAPEVANPILSEKPRVDAGALRAPAQLGDRAAREIERDLAALQKQIIQDQLPAKGRPALRAAELGRELSGGAGLGAAADAGRVPGYSDLDELLTTAGGVLKGDEKPIYMPGGAIFAFDSYTLRPEAVERLRKLAKLIAKNPNTSFSIEGHTDSFGTPEYNLELSRRRAEAVRVELAKLGVNPALVTTSGFGDTRLIVQPDPAVRIGGDPAAFAREQARQAPNRRVEIVIRPHR